MATPKFPLFQLDTIAENIYHYEWLEFTGQAANALQDYFTSFNNVIDLLPEKYEVWNMKCEVWSVKYNVFSFDFYLLPSTF